MNNTSAPWTSSMPSCSAARVATEVAGTLGLGAVVVPEVASLPVDVAPAAPACSPADHFDRSPTPGAVADRVEKHEPARKDEARANPFELLPREALPLPERKVCDKPVDVSRELDPEWGAAVRLAQFEAHLGQAAQPVASVVRKGLMLLTADGQAARYSRLPIEPAKIETLAQKILEKQTRFGQEDHRAFLSTSERLRALVARDINAYVQRVLRECYQIQNESLCDYAAKVEHLNKMRAKTREVLAQARETKNLWHSQAENPDAFLADPPFAWLEVGDDEQSYTPLMTEADVAQWRAETEAAARAEGQSRGGSYTEQWQAYRGPSRLTAEERHTLERLKKNKDTSFFDNYVVDVDSDTDDYIKDHIDELLPLIPNMTAADIDEYLVPIIDILTSGNADEDELLQIFGALSPVQFLALYANDTASAALEATAKDVMQMAVAPGDEFVGALESAWSSIDVPWLGESKGEGKIPGVAFECFNSKERADLDDIGWHAATAVSDELAVAFSGELTCAKAKQLLAGLETHNGVGAGAGAEPQVGAPKQIRTLAQMETLIKHHEDNLNSMGEDAQLANVDLQNALQKQQQTLQMLSNMSKMLFETAMAVVRRLGA